MLLHDSAFPDSFINWAHPADYLETSEPISPEFTYHHSRTLSHSRRLLFRTSLQLQPKRFVSLTFVLLTGAPNHLYLSKRAIGILQGAQLLKEDQDMMQTNIKLDGRLTPVDELPYKRKDANIIGLPLLARLGLCVTDQPKLGFKFTQMANKYLVCEKGVTIAEERLMSRE